VHLGYGTWIWLSVSNLPLKCAVVSMYSVVKQRLKCNTGKVFNCLIQFNSGSGLYRRSLTPLPTPFVSAQRLSERTIHNLQAVCQHGARYYIRVINTAATFWFEHPSEICFHVAVL
jgi:hypothetical protein